MISRLFCKNIIARDAKQYKKAKTSKMKTRQARISVCDISSSILQICITSFHILLSPTINFLSFFSIPWFILVAETSTFPVWSACMTHTSIVCNRVLWYITRERVDTHYLLSSPLLPFFLPFPFFLSPPLLPFIHIDSESILSTDIPLSICLSLPLGALPAVACRYDRWVSMAPVTPRSKSKAEMG